MKIDILIPTCKKPHILEPLIKNIQMNTSEVHRIIYSGFPVSASINRNFTHDAATSNIIVMMDDDIDGFFNGWLSMLTAPLMEDENIRLVSARYLRTDGKTPAHMMAGNYNLTQRLVTVNKCPTACFAYRKKDLDALKGFHNTSSLPFDEKFVGSGWEDDALCFDLINKFPGCRFVINNEVKLIHINEMKNQHTDGNFKKNKEYFLISGRKW